MMYLEEATFGALEIVPMAIEVGIWEGNLIRNKTNIAATLCTYSLDGGPLQETAEGTLVFRFTAFDWQKSLRDLLTLHNIHFSEIRLIPGDSLEQVLKKKIYIADGDPEILFPLSDTLESAGYRVRRSSGGAAIVKGHFSTIDLFILGRQMPDIDGLTICRHLRASAATREIPIILISAYPKIANDARNAGATDCIEKPFEVHYLLNLISKYTKHKR